MCGIVGHIGSKQVLPILLDGLKKLEYRGYDSAGVSFVSKGSLQTTRRPSRTKNRSHGTTHTSTCSSFSAESRRCSCPTTARPQ